MGVTIKTAVYAPQAHEWGGHCSIRQKWWQWWQWYVMLVVVWCGVVWRWCCGVGGVGERGRGSWLCFIFCFQFFSFFNIYFLVYFIFDKIVPSNTNKIKTCAFHTQNERSCGWNLFKMIICAKMQRFEAICTTF